MATLRDLKPCINDGEMAEKRRDGWIVEFVCSPDGGASYWYDEGYSSKTFTSFDELLTYLGEDEPEWEDEQWDLAEDLTEEELQQVALQFPFVS